MNQALLIYEMDRAGVSIKDMCKILGISRSTFYRKCNEKSQFKQAEIKAIVDTLALTNPADIFFAK